MPNPTSNISDHGAMGDGQTLNTKAIQSAIDLLSGGGGGTLIIPRGTFRTGAIFLAPGVHLHIAAEGILQGSTDVADYPRRDTRIEGHTEPWCPALVNASRCDGLRITGPGMIRGGGRPFWDAFWNGYNANPAMKNLDIYRPRNLFIEDSRDVSVSGLRLRDSGFWNFHLFRCSQVLIEAMDIQAPYPSPSTDGIDIDSCQHVTIRGCHISVNDDCIAIKGNKGPFADQLMDIPAVEHIRISNCTFGLGHGVLTLGSEACVVRDVVMENCTVHHQPTPPEAVESAQLADRAAAPSDMQPETNVLARLKLRPDTPQRYGDIHWKNITLSGRCEIITIKPWTQFYDLKGQAPPKQIVQNISIENVTGAVDNFGLIDGPEHSHISNVRFRNIDVVGGQRPILKKIEELVLENVRLNDEDLGST